MIRRLFDKEAIFEMRSDELVQTADRVRVLARSYLQVCFITS